MAVTSANSTHFVSRTAASESALAGSPAATGSLRPPRRPLSTGRHGRPNRWKQRLVNAFALVALPSAMAFSAGADDGVVRLGTHPAGKAGSVVSADTGVVKLSDESADGVVQTQYTPPPGVPALDDTAAPGLIPPSEMPPATVSPAVIAPPAPQAAPIVQPAPIAQPAPLPTGPAPVESILPPAGPAYGPAPVETAPFMGAPVTPSVIGGAAPSAAAAPIGEPGGAIGYSLTPDPSAVLYSIGRRNREILGVDEGFTSIGGYIPFKQTSATSHLFFNPRAIVTDRGKGAVNLGGGHRIYNPATDRLTELSGWWDYDDGHAESYQQLGVHLASLGALWSYRAGANFVVGDDLNELGSLGFSDARLSGNSILFTDNRLSEVAFNRYYGEVEVPMGVIDAYGFTTAVGAYYLDATDEAPESVGLSARVEAQVTEDLWVNVAYTHDDIFDSNLSINCQYTLPTSLRPSKWFRKPCPADLLYGTTRRPYRVATDTFVAERSTEAVNPKTGRAFQIAFIDPNVANADESGRLATGAVGDAFGSTGDFMSLDSGTRSLFDAIVVRPNDPTLVVSQTVGLGGEIETVNRMPGDDLGTPITLLDCQSLLGEQALGGFLTNTLGLDGADVGNFALSSTMRPVINNAEAPGVDVVTLVGGGHTVAGVTIDATGTADAIVGANQTQGFAIFDNEFVNFQRAIAIDHFGDGIGLVRDNAFDGNGPDIVNLDGTTTINFGASDGLLLNQNNGQLDLLVANNTLVGINGEDANENGVIDPTEDLNGNGLLDTGEDRNGNGRLDLAEDVNNNGILDPGRGITITATGVGSFINAGDAPSGLPDGLAPDATVGIVNNSIGVVGEVGTGTLFGITVNAIDGGLVELTETDNVVGGGVRAAAGLIDPGYVLVADNGMIDVFNFEDNLSVGVGGLEDGGQFTARNNGQIRFDDRNAETSAFDGNVFTSNGGNGLVVTADNGLISFDQILGNDFGASDLSDDGVLTPGEGGGVGTGEATTFAGTIITGSLSGGTVMGTAATSADPNVMDGDQLTSTTVTNGTIAGGIVVDSDGPLEIGQQIQVTISDTTAVVDATAVNLDQAEVEDTAFTGTVIVTSVPSLAAGVTLDDGTGNLEDGLVLQAVNNGVIVAEQPLDQNTFIGNGGNGLTVRAETGGRFQGDFGFTGTDDEGQSLTGTNTFTDNLGAGISLQAGAGSQLDTSVSNLTLTGNIGGGLELMADGGVLNVTSFQNNDLSGNGTFGAALVVNDGGTLILPGISNSDFNNNSRAGILISGTNESGGPDGTLVLGDVVNNRFLRGVSIDENGVQGISARLTDLDGNDPNLPDISQALFGSLVAGGTVIDTGAFFDQFDLQLVDSGFFGIEFDSEDVVVTGNLIQNQFLGAIGQQTTVDVGVIDPNNDTVSVQTVAVNLDQIGPGIGGTASGGGVNLTLGTSEAVERNIFTNNGDGHIALLLEGDSVNNIEISKHVLNDSTDASGPFDSSLFNGVGFGVVLRDSASLSGFITDSVVSDNAADGVLLSVSGNSLMGGDDMMGEFATLDNFVIGGAGDARIDPDVANNIITGNGDAGIRIVRTGNGLIDNLQILGNQVDGNGGDNTGINFVDETGSLFGGLVIDVANTQTIDTITADFNTFNNNTGPGAFIFERGDALLTLDFDNNEFINNSLAGIQVSEQILSLQDQRGVGGEWTSNLITDNGQDGISINGATQNLSIGLIDNPDSGNTILRNRSDGIEYNAAGDIIIANNRIAQNGIITGIGPNATEGGLGETRQDFDAGFGTFFANGTPTDNIAGIDIDALGFASNVGIFQNDVTDNRGDGIEFVNATTGDFDLTIVDNVVDFNDGRGFDYLLVAIGQGAEGASFSSSTVVFDDNNINSNLLEGVYIVTTAAGEQVQDNASFEDLAIASADISYLSSYSLDFSADNNEIISNGRNVVSGETANVNQGDALLANDESTINGDRVGDADNSAGFVVRVGTAGGGYDYRSNGGFANEDQLFTFPDGTLDANGLPIIPAPVVFAGSSLGGIDMALTNNKFGGNFGSDLYFESFTSTQNPPDTQGVWENQDPTDNDVEFRIDRFDGDPLARLDLTLLGNIIPTADPTNVGAFYENGEGDFKSRTAQSDDGPVMAEEGPFDAANRYRNAQRTAIRLYPDPSPDETNPTTPLSVLDPLAPNADNFAFRFPGMGDSTFRVNVEDLTAADLFQLEMLGFVFDDNPVVGGTGNASFGDLSPIESLFERRGPNYQEEPGDFTATNTEYGWGTFGTPDGFTPNPGTGGGFFPFINP